MIKFSSGVLGKSLTFDYRPRAAFTARGRPAQTGCTGTSGASTVEARCRLLRRKAVTRRIGYQRQDYGNRPGASKVPCPCVSNLTLPLASLFLKAKGPEPHMGFRAFAAIYRPLRKAVSKLIPAKKSSSTSPTRKSSSDQPTLAIASAVGSTFTCW